MQEAHRRFQASRKDENQRISRTKRQKCGGGRGEGEGRLDGGREGNREKREKEGGGRTRMR